MYCITRLTRVERVLVAEPGRNPIASPLRAKSPQAESKPDQEKPRKQGLDSLGFPWIPSCDSRFFNGLRGNQRKKIVADPSEGDLLLRKRAQAKIRPCRIILPKASSRRLR
jgi:hypothetical protein